LDEKDEKKIFSLYGEKADLKISKNSKFENSEHTENDGIKKLLSWLELLATINSKENKIKYEKCFDFSSTIKPKDLLQSLYERYFIFFIFFYLFIIFVSDHCVVLTLLF
jgi:hypothetical protein